VEIPFGRGIEILEEELSLSAGALNYLVAQLFSENAVQKFHQRSFSG
jgi:hypothetical protein